MPNGKPDLGPIFEQVQLIASSLRDAAGALEGLARVSTEFRVEELKTANEEQRAIIRSRGLMREIQDVRLRGMLLEKEELRDRQEMIKKYQDAFEKYLKQTLNLGDELVQKILEDLKKTAEMPKPITRMTPEEVMRKPLDQIFSNLGGSLLAIIRRYLTLGFVLDIAMGAYKREVIARRMSILATEQLGKQIQYTSGVLGVGARIQDGFGINLERSMIDLQAFGHSVGWTTKDIEELAMYAAKAGVASEDISNFGQATIAASVSTGMNTELSKRFFTDMYRKVGMGGDQLSGAFQTLRKHQQGSTLALDEYTEQTLDLYNATRLYGGSIIDSMSIVSKFGAAIKDGTLTVGQLSQALLSPIQKTPGFLVGITYLIERTGGIWGEWMHKKMAGAITPLERFGRSFVITGGGMGGLGMALTATAAAMGKQLAAGGPMTKDALYGGMRLAFDKFGIAPWNVSQKTLERLIQFSQMTPDELAKNKAELEKIMKETQPLEMIKDKAITVAQTTADILTVLTRFVETRGWDWLTKGIAPPGVATPMAPGGAAFAATIAHLGPAYATTYAGPIRPEIGPAGPQVAGPALSISLNTWGDFWTAIQKITSYIQDHMYKAQTQGGYGGGG